MSNTKATRPYNFIIGNATLHPKTLDLRNSIITLDDATLGNSDIAIEIASLF